jgi:hypothetical protein
MRLKEKNKNLEKNKPQKKITHDEIEKNKGIAKTKGKLLKALMREKNIERKY